MKTPTRFWYGTLLLVLMGMITGMAAAGTPDEKTEREIQAVKNLVRTAASGNVLSSADTRPGATMKPDLPSPAKISGITAQKDRKSIFINGNKIATMIYNYGGISPGYDALRGVNNLVWRNLDYVFQFCPIVGAAVPSEGDPSRRIHIISDGLWDYPALREVNPTGDTLWQWQPLPGYADPDQPDMASNPADDDNGDGKPDSWPRTWYNPTLGKYVWPGFLSQDILSADLEVFWAMDDRFNTEFPYSPSPSDPARKGIGVQVDGRVFQWSNALAENTIFFVYTITNTSEKDLDSVFFGIYGDPDLGGGSPENTDDRGFFVRPYDSLGSVNDIPVYSRSLVFFWDQDMRGARGLPLGYVGCKFLESPGNPTNLLDDDGDGRVNERQDDGIDNDGDWSALTDDVGVDGVPNSQDEGEGNGVPDAGKRLSDGSQNPLFPGEPNFELTDLDESDQIGLTSFNSWTWNTDRISNDESMWNRSLPGNFGSIQQNADIVFIFGSGYITLAHAETKRISTALLLAEDLDGLLTTARTVQTIYNKNYQFFRPPITPTMTAVPDDKKVTLYWDTKAEQSVDPITGNDFEGYVIYRSTDPAFNDIQTVTDGKGSRFLTEPLTDVKGAEAKWDVAVRQERYTDVNKNGKYDTGEPFVDVNKDGRWSEEVEDPWKGYHPVPYQDRGIQYYLGNNRGLVHSFVDSNKVINGQTYYYAVVAYDHGDSTGIPPTETTKKINEDPITSVLKFDVNTAQVVPGPRTSGYVPPAILSKDVTHDRGIATGSVQFRILNDLTVPSGGQYQISFADSFQNGNFREGGKNFSVLDTRPITDTFVPFDTNYSALSRSGIANDSFLKVTGANGTTYTQGVDYVMNFQRGSIRRTSGSAMPTNGATYRVQYRYFPVFESRALKAQDSNPVFDGVELRINDHPVLAYDSLRSRWVEGTSNFSYVAKLTSIGTRKRLWPADYEIRFSSQNIDTALVQSGGLIKVPVRYSVSDVTTGSPQRILTFLAENTSTRDQQWSSGEEIVLFKPGATGAGTDTTTWGVVITKPADTIATTPRVPRDGDVLLIATQRPFYTEDLFTLKTEAATVDNALASSVMDNIYVVPNPYVGLSDIEPTNRLPGATRGERRVYFEHLPSRCTIRIFTINGDLVHTLEHEAGMDNGREFWNLLNRDGFSVAYGVYIAHIDAPGIGEKTLKFALIK